MVGEIQITVIEIKGDKVRLGIEAPKNVPVHRKEIYELIQRKKNDEVKS
jgi:carbon storage regulator